MNASLGFPVDETHHVRQLDLEKDRPAIGALGLQCIGYLRQAKDAYFAPRHAPDRLLKMLVPTCVPAARSFVLGILRAAGNPAAQSPVLVGVLFFLHPPAVPDTWYIPLLLLEPAARGRGIGAAVHEAFASWALARGARRLMVAVADDNPRARRFWCGRMGYLEVPAHARQKTGDPARWKPEFVRHLAPAERVRLRAA